MARGLDRRETQNALERRQDARPRVSYTTHLATIPHRLPSTPQNPRNARTLYRIVCAHPARRGVDVRDERGRGAEEGVGRALGGGECETGLQQVDDDDGFDAEVDGSPEAV